MAPRPWTSRNILITGGTGSLGQAFCAWVLRHRPPRTLTVFSRDEFKQSEMRANPTFQHPAMRWVIGDVRDRTRLEDAMTGINTVVHAAAMKQVPAIEDNPLEAVRTNIIGTMHVLEACITKGVQQACFISSDKSVAASTTYGGTKFTAERLWIRGAKNTGESNLALSAVRYGNVAGSRGSVVPYFRKLITEGRPITLTDDRMTRFWITLDQAVHLITSAIDRSEDRKAGWQSAEILIPKLPAFRVPDLARAMTGIFGGEISPTNKGIRLGEKLHEVLISRDESRSCDWEHLYHTIILRPNSEHPSTGVEVSSETTLHEPVDVIESWVRSLTRDLTGF